MPDLDRFHRTFAKGWLKVFRLAKNTNTSDQEFEASCLKALTQTLTLSRGCPGLFELSNIIDNILISEIDGKLFEACDQIRKVEREQNNHPSTKLAAKAAMNILVKSHDNPMDSNDKGINRLAEQFCIELMNFHFFGRGRNYLVEERFNNFTNANNWEKNIKTQMKNNISTIADQLIKNPTSDSYIPPRFFGLRKPTKELLIQPL
jgi:hypothetical protein